MLLVNPLSRADGSLRFGVTVTKKIGNAVARNRMKRRFRALLRELLNARVEDLDAARTPGGGGGAKQLGRAHGLEDLPPAQGIAGADHGLRGRENGVERDFALLRSELGQALSRAAAGKGDPPRKPGGKSGGKPGTRRGPPREPKPAYGR